MLSTGLPPNNSIAMVKNSGAYISGSHQTDDELCGIIGRQSEHSLIGGRDVNFPEFYFSIREIQILRLVEYSKGEIQCGTSVWTMHLMRECSRHHATQLWLGGGPGKCNDSGSCSGVKLQSVPVSSVLETRQDRLRSSQAHHTLCPTAPLKSSDMLALYK